MPKHDALRVDVVKHEDKEARLVDFIRSSLIATAGAPSEALEAGIVSVVARSFDSPVMLALNAALADVPADTIMVRSIVFEKPKTLGATPSDRPIAVLRSQDVRWLKDRRFEDAHEQLVLGPTTCWIGDCMRRDPAKRDAFESTTTLSHRATAYAMRSFDRLWQAATPLPRLPLAANRTERPLATAVAEAETPPPPGAGEDPAKPSASTRH